jgi:hypothetical protein
LISRGASTWRRETSAARQNGYVVSPACAQRQRVRVLRERGAEAGAKGEQAESGGEAEAT